MTDQIRLVPLHRIGSANPQKLERHSFDFIVNGVSLFEATQALEYDMCGSLSNPQFEREIARGVNGRTAAMLTSDVPAGGHRVALFVCPECGDFACGAITTRLSRTERGVQWSDFAYENGSDAASKFGLGPFEFEWAAYLSEIERSKAD
ncbi:hypothetical protein JJE66_22940 [Bradyrhizobium diazoefficiens]|uniref:hypothetical protein n=1 Tax=Bradyrhizobium diazoefficiens TaxID=1355477 RepID=UPI00190A8C07|nr:hypothetical protein [Bradyrhizobium diazoefficiens]MBK3664067.1 hypothetical protein [Bradyrhizobium diazoefficiens]